MTFSYTDDAIVSSSPTGRHLSTVIKRPCVLMSGWDQHAEAVCKVLNDLQPDHPVRNLTVGAGVSQLREELRSMLKDDREIQGLPDDPAELKTWKDYGNRIYTFSLEQRKQLEAARRELEEATTKLCAAQMLLEQPIEVNGPVALSLYSACPGTQLYHLDTKRTFKRV